MTEPLKNLLILLIGIAVILLLVILLFGGRSPVMRFLSFFLEEDENVRTTRMNNYRSRKQPRRGAPQENYQGQHVRGAEPADGIDSIEAQKKTSEPVVEMATLIQKSDDRLRVIENSGRVRMIDEYYELLFVTRKGQKLKIQCSPEAYEKMPFDEQGSLTYKRNTLVKFKLYDETIYNDHTEEEKAENAGG